jgi:hypothetical protein
MKRTGTTRLHHQHILFAETNAAQVKEGLLQGLGLLGWARAEPVFSTQHAHVVMSCNPRMINEVKAASVLCSPRLTILRISGTLAGLERTQ